VALAPSAFAPSLGGVEELVRQLAHEQEAAGGRPLVVTMRWPLDLPAAEVVEGTPVRRFVFRAPDGRPRDRLASAATSPFVVRRVLAALRSHHAELVHVQCVSAGARPVARAARLAGLPLVVTLQGELTMDATGVYERSSSLRRTLRELLATADAVTACSRSTLDEASTWAQLDLGARGTVVPNGVRRAELVEVAPFEHPRPYLFALGRHVPQKGFDVLVEAFGRLVAAGDQTTDLLLAGDGPEHGRLGEQVLRAGLADRVTLVGRTDRRQTAALLAGCAAFVLPSRHEPFGIVNLEAMAVGRAVVASDVGGVAEVVEDGQTGLLVPPGRADALAAALRGVLDDPTLASRLGVAGRRRAARFEWSEVARRYDEVYERAASRARAER
jgi:glycosyltransferase involved in cell wall biosynthesis